MSVENRHNEAESKATPEMVAAGVKELRSWIIESERFSGDDDQIVASVYERMCTACDPERQKGLRGSVPLPDHADNGGVI